MPLGFGGLKLLWLTRLSGVQASVKGSRVEGFRSLGLLWTLGLHVTRAALQQSHEAIFVTVKAHSMVMVCQLFVNPNRPTLNLKP